MPPPSASAARLAAHWVADALAADEVIDFSAVKALLGVSPEFLVGAPESARERVALRSLQELVSVAASAEGDTALAPPAAGMLRFDAARSCESVLLDLVGEVGSSKSLDKELLREVDPEIPSIASSSPVEQKDNAELQQENLTNSQTEARNFQKRPIEPTANFHQPSIADSRCYNHPQEDAADAAGIGSGSLETSLPNVEMSAAVPASASCNVALQGSLMECLSKNDVVDCSTVVQPKPCTGKSPDQLHCDGVKRPNDDGAMDRSSKDPCREEPTMQATIAPAFDRSNDALPTYTSEASHLPEFMTKEDTTIIKKLRSCETRPSSSQHDSSEKVNQDLDDGSASIQPIKKGPINQELNLRAASVVPSASCNGAMQGDKSETSHPPGNMTEHTTMLDHQIGDKSPVEVGGTNHVNQTLCHDSRILEKNTICSGLNAQDAPESHRCNATLHVKVSEVNYLSENIGKNTTDIQKRSCNISVINSPRHGDEERIDQDSNKQTSGSTVAERSHGRSSDDIFDGFAAAGLLSVIGKMQFFIQDQEANGSLWGSSEQDLCIKCRKDGQLLQCNSCSLAAHDSCFGLSVTFEDSGKFYCPICVYNKATVAYREAKKTYDEAMENVAAFLGMKQTLKQHDEQQTGVLSRASSKEGKLRERGSSKRKNGHRTKVYNMTDQVEELDQQRKKQKPNDTSDACREEVVTEKTCVLNSDVAAMNKTSALQNDSNPVQDALQDQQVENTEAHEAACNANSSHGRRSSCQNRCSPSSNLEAEADKEDGPANSHQPEDSDVIEPTSSNDSDKGSSPPWRNMRHERARLQQNLAAVSSKSRKTFGQQDQCLPSSSKRKYAYPPKR
ncbi:hypothetical protein ACP70R_027120 [Stipagrostis hirtigluma subsp. patula]